MSGTVDVSAILPTLQPQTNWLQTVNGFQDLANKQQALKNAIAQNAQIQASTANTVQQTSAGAQTQAIQGATRHAQDMASILALPESQMPAAALQKMDQELATGQISQAQYDAGKQTVQQAAQTGDVSMLKRIAAQFIMSNLSGAEQVKAATPGLTQTDIGGQIVPQTSPSAISMAGGTAPAISGAPGAINRSLAPGYVNVGNAQLPVGGAIGQPALVNGVSPETAGQITTVIDPATGLPTVGRNADQGGLATGGYAGAPGVGTGTPVQAGTPGGAVRTGPNTVPANETPPPGGFRLAGANVQTPQQGGTMGVGGPAQGGILGHGPVSVNPQAVQAQADNYKDFRAAQTSIPTLKTQEGSLQRAFALQQQVVTGAGSDVLQAMRSRVALINQATGGKIDDNTIKTANFDELGKYYHQIAANAGAGGASAGVQEAFMSGNPNQMLQAMANSNVLSSLIGKNRQQQLEVAMTHDQTTGRDFQVARQTVAQLDPHALAWDTMTPMRREETMKEVLKSPVKTKNFYKTLAIARQYNVIPAAAAPQPTATPPAPAAPASALQGGSPPNALQ